MAERRPRVLVFDSGAGGLSVAACIHRALPGAKLVYLADNAGFPYGDKPGGVVIARCCSLIRQCLVQFPCDVVVVACNTASTVVLPELRAMTDVPVVGVVPAVKPAAARSGNRRIGLLATPATIKRPYLDELIQEFARDCQVVRLGHPALVRWAEELVAGQAPDQALMDEALAPLKEAGVDTVVLGCTHYPLLLPWLRKGLPDVRHWVESGEAIARRVGYWLEQAGTLGVAQTPMADAGPVVACACFSGGAPADLPLFMAEMGIAVDQVADGWPGVTATGSV
ncbi:glutamate racemase [Marinobacter daepoensis]|uniref:glutamate racemase n=1 Tax=Marinobacter daepoensis TaxID=262077 RepID=UPI001C977F05|nr:glutamate racemase [Marinobacter daepoensis]MBY6034327.1 glutamate racemase [Marinobacter daepoensis]